MQPRPNPSFSSAGSSMESAYNSIPQYLQAQSSTYYNSHYLQAYAQSQPQTSYSSNNHAHASVSPANTYPSQSQRSNHAVASHSWYNPGNHRCTYGGCSFTGSAKSVEIHMMDRHLIYPPGWDKRKKVSDWDADPSLKGKPIPIQGTNVVLDSPEVLEAWIAERKKRFPTSARVEDKKRKMDEAIARGQLDLRDTRGRENKRRKTTEDARPDQSNRRNQAVEGGSKPFHNRTQDSGWGAKSQMKLPSQPVRPSPTAVDSNGDDDDDEAPEVVSSKLASRTSPPPQPSSFNEASPMIAKEKEKKSGNQRNSLPLQPKMPASNPFAARPKLLRSLLLPEIRVTVSNLSQAIRFLVDNDFLRDVELKPGQAAERNKIEVVQADERKSSEQ